LVRHHGWSGDRLLRSGRGVVAPSQGTFPMFVEYPRGLVASFWEGNRCDEGMWRVRQRGNGSLIVGEEFHAASAIQGGKLLCVAMLVEKRFEESVDGGDAQWLLGLLNDPGEAGVAGFVGTIDGVAVEVGWIEAEYRMDIPPGFTWVEGMVNPFEEEAKARMTAAGLELLAVGVLGDVLDGTFPVVDHLSSRWLVVRRCGGRGRRVRRRPTGMVRRGVAAEVRPFGNRWAVDSGRTRG
jgi:hypothetical protein